MDHSSDNSQQPSAAPTPVAGAVVSQRRRRFIQAGVVPVGLTLASRPVMAWHCNTTSAWGSAVLRNGGASVKARAELAEIDNTECWYISDWIKNSTRPQVRNSATPWSCAAKKWYSGKSDTWVQNNLPVSKVFPSGLKGVSPSANVFTLIKKDAPDFAAIMLAARLNTLLANTPVSSCTISNGTDMLPQMASLGPNVFKPANSTGAAWTAKDMNDYLKANWLI